MYDLASPPCHRSVGGKQWCLAWWCWGVGRHLAWGAAVDLSLYLITGRQALQECNLFCEQAGGSFFIWGWKHHWSLCQDMLEYSDVLFPSLHNRMFHYIHPYYLKRFLGRYRMRRGCGTHPEPDTITHSAQFSQKGLQSWSSVSHHQCWLRLVNSQFPKKCPGITPPCDSRGTVSWRWAFFWLPQLDSTFQPTRANCGTWEAIFLAWQLSSYSSPSLRYWITLSRFWFLLCSSPKSLESVSESKASRSWDIPMLLVLHGIQTGVS